MTLTFDTLSEVLRPLLQQAVQQAAGQQSPAPTDEQTVGCRVCSCRQNSLLACMLQHRVNSSNQLSPQTSSRSSCWPASTDTWRPTFKGELELLW